MTNPPKATKEFVQQAVAQILCANTLSPIVQMLSAQLFSLYIQQEIFGKFSPDPLTFAAIWCILYLVAGVV